MFPALGFGPVKSVAGGKGISEVPLESGAAFQMCRAAGLPPPAAAEPAGREKGSRTQQRICLTCGRHWEQVAKRRGKSSLMGNIPCNFGSDCIRKFAAALLQANLL